MTSKVSQKLNDIINKNHIDGMVYLNSWLVKRGISPSMIYYYRKKKLIQSIGDEYPFKYGVTLPKNERLLHSGVFTKFNEIPDYYGGVQALQKQLELNVHVAADHALMLQKVIPNLINWKKEKVLFAPKGVMLPKWFFEAPWYSNVLFKSTTFLPQDIGIEQTGKYQLLTSRPERAILELIYLIPNNMHMRYIHDCIKKLTNIDIDLMHELLENCTSNRVKRLFLYLIEEENLSWLEKLKVGNLDLGKGTIVIEKPGKHNSKYKIVVSDFSNDIDYKQKFRGIPL